MIDTERQDRRPPTGRRPRPGAGRSTSRCRRTVAALHHTALNPAVLTLAVVGLLVIAGGLLLEPAGGGPFNPTATGMELRFTGPAAPSGHLGLSEEFTPGALQGAPGLPHLTVHVEGDALTAGGPWQLDMTLPAGARFERPTPDGVPPPGGADDAAVAVTRRTLPGGLEHDTVTPDPRGTGAMTVDLTWDAVLQGSLLTQQSSRIAYSPPILTASWSGTATPTATTDAPALLITTDNKLHGVDGYVLDSGHPYSAATSGEQVWDWPGDSTEPQAVPPRWSVADGHAVARYTPHAIDVIRAHNVIDDGEAHRNEFYGGVLLGLGGGALVAAVQELLGELRNRRRTVVDPAAPDGTAPEGEPVPPPRGP